MKRYASALAMGLLSTFLVASSSCASFRAPLKTSLDVIHGQVQGLRLTLRDVCKPALQHCIDRSENPCDELNRCSKARDKALVVLLATEQAVKIGYQSLEVAETEDEIEAITKGIGAATEDIVEIVSLVKQIKEEF